MGLNEIITNAKEVLLNFANEENSWLSDVISSYILANGNVGDSKKEELINLIFENKENDGKSKNCLSSHFGTGKGEKQKNIKLELLQHIEGVNSLMENQKINFSNDVTFIYGLNGSGKSSYYRVLYNMSNKYDNKIIYNNIYKDNADNKFSAVLKYRINNNNKQFCWDNNSSDDELTEIRFFDTKLSEKMLQKRNSDELLLKPFGLNMFSEIIELVDELKKKAKEKVEIEKKQIPLIDTKDLSEKFCKLNDDIDYSCIKDELLQILKCDIEKLSKECEDNKKQRLQLLQSNNNSAIELNKVKVQTYTNIKYKIVSIGKDYEKYANEILKQNKLKEELQNKKSQIELIKSIVNSDNDDWNRFIKYGLDNQKYYPNKCPFCQRKYDNSALEIIKAYTEYLQNDCEKNYNESISITKDLRNNLLTNFNAIDESYLINIDDILKNEIKEWKKSVLDSIDNIDSKGIILNKDLINEIDNYITKLNNDIKELDTDQNNKQEKINILESKIIDLKEKISLINQKDKIEDLIVKKENVEKMADKIEAISTIKLSNLSKKAHEQLLTKSLKSIFIKKMKDILETTNIEIDLNMQNTKGINQMELSIKGKKLLEILSEGEQKAVALALFLSEIELSQNNNPIIFDDPINSMDNRLADNFANALLKIDNQIVVFSHNLLFLESFHTSKIGHICKTYGTSCNRNDKGRHIFIYEVKSCGKNEKGVITKYLLDTPKECLKRIDGYLNEKDFNKETECSVLLRQTVELVIDSCIFKNQVPPRFSSKNNRFQWEELKKIGAKPIIIDELRSIHDRCSGGEMHFGIERTYNPLTKEEIENMKNKLLEILNINKTGEYDERFEKK